MTSSVTSTSHAGQTCWFLTMQGLTLALLLTFLLSFSAAPFLTPTSVRARSWALRRHLRRLLLLEEDGFLRDSLVDGELKMQPIGHQIWRRIGDFHRKQKQKPRVVIVKKFFMLCWHQNHVVLIDFFIKQTNQTFFFLF